MCLVKICALTNVVDATAALDAGADFLGVIFAPKSKRVVSIASAKEIALLVQSRQSPISLPVLDVVYHRPILVGVFQNQTVDEVNRIATEVGLDFIQLHGDESPDMPTLLQKPVIRALGVNADSRMEDVWKEIERFRPFVSAILLDTKTSSAFGGAGQAFDWNIARNVSKLMPVIVAGGLNPENVAYCVGLVTPFAVDVASGVESEIIGKKDHRKMQEFVNNTKK